MFIQQLDSVLAKYNILCNQQYGFHSIRSTSLAVINFFENITTAVENKEITIGFFIDLWKAFDTIDHNLLLQKCDWFGIR